MDWVSIAKEGAAIAMAGLLLWRFERTTKQRAVAEGQARDAFLTALKDQRTDDQAALAGQRTEYQEYLGNHLSQNRVAQEHMTEVLGHLCEQQAVVATVIQKCVKPPQE